jgi:hypothetical protein
MEYRLPCPCGEDVPVPESAAGTSVLCHCGRSVTVPSLRELRRQWGVEEPEFSVEMAVDALLHAGKLPEEDHCVLCGMATDGTICCYTECEKAYVQERSPSWLAMVLAFLTFGLLGAVIVAHAPRKRTEWGRDHIYSLPLRVCDACRQELTSVEALKDALCRVPLYRRLLKKYPAARVSLLPS